VPSDSSATTTPSLPPARRAAGPYRIGIICLGNICRSPIAEVVLRRTFEREGIGDLVRVDSGGTGDWHMGQAMDQRASATLQEAGYDGSAHRARQVTASWFDDHDVLLAMDAANHRALSGLAPAQAAERLRMFRDFDPQVEDDREVPDPFGGGAEDFAAVLRVVERTATELARQLRPLLR
jgi:low molecular weight protein-tyrosine phosphatase